MAAAGVSADFKDQFRCVSCNKYLRPPVITCVKGHNVCGVCHVSLKKCPKGNCAYTKPPVQNATIEAMLKTLKLPLSCKHAGCDRELSNDDVNAHEEECHHRKIRCPLLDCLREIKMVDLEGHLASAHQSIMNGKWTKLKIQPEGGPTPLITLGGPTSYSSDSEFSSSSSEEIPQMRVYAYGARAAHRAERWHSTRSEQKAKSRFMKIWVQFGGKRMFAVIIVTKDFWHLCTTEVSFILRKHS